MQKYSIFSLVKNALTGHQNWDLAWKDPNPKEEYDVVIIGGGGHGLATAYYLAKEHQITKVAIIEKGWIGGGNVGRNTTIIRSNYMHDENGLFSEFGMDLWRKMSQDLNYNVMFSPRGIINLAHSDAQMNAYARRGNSMRLNGIDAVLLNREEVKELIPMAIGINSFTSSLFKRTASIPFNLIEFPLLAYAFICASECARLIIPLGENITL